MRVVWKAVRFFVGEGLGRFCRWVLVRSMAVTAGSRGLPRHYTAAKAKRLNKRRQAMVQGRTIRVVLLAALLLFAAGLYRLFFASSLRMSSFRASSSYSSLVMSADEAGTHSGVMQGARVDISMKELYDRINFDDIDGGAWKQGWNVEYRGDEWDERKLRVFVVPHSHNDPGWLRTVEEYYQGKSRYIIATIIDALRKDKRRKFIWEEMSYLERWWRDASELDKKDLGSMVKSGQLEIVGGGWVMNDEANSHYFALIEQMTEGNLWLYDNLGVTPKNAWSIDPFGYSPTMAYLLKRMGFKNMLIQRSHYEVKKALAKEQNLEFVWRQSWDSGNTTDIFCHMMPFYSYDIPHTCGPDPAVCCQFDFWRLPGHGTAQFCPWGRHPMEITAQNVKERAELLLDQYRKKSTLYKTNTLLVPLGDDFRYVTSEEAELQFTNYQLMFDYINGHPELKAEAQFGTLEDYFTALRAEVAAADAGQGSSDTLPGFPVLSGDFFTYADREKDYWSGYYVSRPFFKAVDRVLEHTLRAGDMVFAFSQAFCRQTDFTGFPLSFSDKLVAARRNLALFQHHDGVTGTAKDHVVNDYGTRMHNSLNDLSHFISSGAAALLHKGECKDASTDLLEAEQKRSKHDVLPEKTLIDTREDASVHRVVLVNTLERAVEQVVSVLVTDPLVCVFDSEWAPIASQASPEWQLKSHGVSTGRHRLHWQAFSPAMGLQTYFIGKFEHQDCRLASLSSLQVYNGPTSFACPPPYTCSVEHGDMAEIKNQRASLFFSTKDGLLRRMASHGSGSPDIMVEEEVRAYSSQGSGAYLFKPTGEATSIVRQGGLVLVTVGQLMQEVLSEPRTIWDSFPLVRSARLYNGNSIQATVAEMDYRVEFLENQYNNKELIVRFNTEVKTNKAFYSDLNGFQVIRRQTYDKIPLQGNYYPMPSLAFLQCPGGRRFSIHSRQALGVASLGDGWLEVMLERRLTRDDNRGLGQGVMDNRPTNVVFHLLVESNKTEVASVAAPYALPSLLSHQVSAELNYPLHLLLGSREQKLNPKHVVERGAVTMTFTPLGVNIPCDLHVVGFKIPRPSSAPDPPTDYSLTLLRRGWDPAYGAHKSLLRHCAPMTDANQLQFSDLFKEFDVTDLRNSSLTLLHDQAGGPARIAQVGRKARAGVAASADARLPAAMEIQAFRFGLKATESG